MSIIETLRNLLGRKDAAEKKVYQVNLTSDGLIFATTSDCFASLEKGQKISLQHTILKMLAEQGLAEVIRNGFLLPKEVVCATLGEDRTEDSELASVLGLAPREELKFRIRVKGISSAKDFAVDVFVETAGRIEQPVNFTGPYLEFAGKQYVRLNTAELLGLEAWRKHVNLTPDERGELSNLNLMAKLQVAKDSGMDIDLGHFEDFVVQVPEQIGVYAHQNADGSLTLRPTIESLSTEQLEQRWGQVLNSDEEGVIRIENTIVLLDKKTKKGIQEVFNNQSIPKSQVKSFIENPSAFLDATVVDLDVGFSTRVQGIGELVYLSFGELDSEKIDWFSDALVEDSCVTNLAEIIKCQEDLTRFRSQYNAAKASGAEVMRFDDRIVDISQPSVIEQQLEDLSNHFRDVIFDESTFDPKDGSNENEINESKKWTLLLESTEEKNSYLLGLTNRKNVVDEIDWDVSSRTPYPHQKVGVEWAVGLINQASQSLEDPVRVQGALLADDMGLGKTYMSLIAINEYYRRLSEQDKTLKPILVIAPLSLLENWKDEVETTFKSSPFSDVQILQSGKDLHKFRVEGVQRESVQLNAQQPLNDGKELGSDHAPEIRFALHVGKEAGPKRLDMPKRLVIATYDTLRSYQFSLCKVDWGLVLFDEAQNVKNPNTLQTRAAKALKADFKLLITGTPVENSLADFWCLMDTAQPGLLGEWPVFRENWVSPIVRAKAEEKEATRVEVGERLRKAVGNFMLRRTKEEELPGLPTKRSYVGIKFIQNDTSVEQLDYLAQHMKDEQLSAYDGILENYQKQNLAEEKGIALSALANLRNISLHPNLVAKQTLQISGKSQSINFIDKSAKLTALKIVLDEIKNKDEKAIIFVISKRMQLLLKQVLDVLFGLNINIINGDTKTVASARNEESSTRKGMIEEFEAKQGFNIIIMSPIAAGVGLTIVGANHVIHLERHWNPAKEAQATDRVYRIGQKKDVCIYYPFSLHPNKQSFDEHLALLLSRKQLLKEAVVTTEPVKESEIANGIFA